MSKNDFVDSCLNGKTWCTVSVRHLRLLIGHQKVSVLLSRPVTMICREGWKKSSMPTRAAASGALLGLGVVSGVRSKSGPFSLVLRAASPLTQTGMSSMLDL